MNLPCGHLYAEAEIQITRIGEEPVIFVRCRRCIGEFCELPTGQLHCVRCGCPDDDALCAGCDAEIEHMVKILHPSPRPRFIVARDPIKTK